MGAEKPWKAAPRMTPACRGVLWRQWEARERQVGRISSEVGLTVVSDIMQSELRGMKCQQARRMGE